MIPSPAPERGSVVRVPEGGTGGGSRSAAGQAALNSQLATIHKFPSTFLWMKLGGIAHILVGIFIALAAIVRTLSLMPHRLSYEMERTQG